MRVVSALLLTGCSFSHGAVSANDAGGPGEASQPMPDASQELVDAPGPACFGSQPIDMVCFDGAPTGSLTLSGPVDTGNFAMCKAMTVGGVAACVIAVDTLTIDDHTTVSVTGTKPLVIVATTSITLMGANSVLDAGGHGHSSGAAARGSGNTCAVLAANPQHGGGGWGASAHGLGGNGANEYDGGGGDAGSGAQAPLVLLPPQALAGGCPGGATVADANAGGGGGGAIALIAPLVHIDGTVTTSGGGGAGGQHNTGEGGGGGGGGSGGLVVLDTVKLEGGGHVLAQGGGGGEGGDATDNDDGHTGTDGFAMAGAGAGGDMGTTQGGAGGSGATGASITYTKAATGGGNNAGGGGGGGAAGWNLVYGATIVPANMLAPTEGTGL
ncbi:MAG TPA: hypothetical protein VLX92_23995 [Kofleriaceae bacterium]|nr:hypothetical protein [Kofleriaceae bacterium]